MSRKPEIIEALWRESDLPLREIAKSLGSDQDWIRQDLQELVRDGTVNQNSVDHEWLYRLSAAGILDRPDPARTNVPLEDIHGILRDPERPYPFFTGGCPAPLKLSLPGIVFTELCGACPMQAEGRANGLGFSFWACHGRWEMEIEQPGNAPARLLSGDDRWQGHMPPSVAFAMIVFKLLWHVCGRDPFYGPATGMGCTPNLDPGQPGSRSLIRSADRECLELIGELARDQSYRDWKGLCTMSDLFIIRLCAWLSGQGPSDYSESTREMLNAVLWESKRRGWTEGWWKDPWEDPSVVLEVKAPAGRARP